MEQDSTKALGKVIRIDEGEVRGHSDQSACRVDDHEISHSELLNP